MKKLIIVLIIGLLACAKQDYIEFPYATFSIIEHSGTEIALDALESTGEDLQYKVNWGFGFTDYTTNPIFKYRYDTIGEFTIILRIKDWQGWTDDCKQKIEIIF